MYCILKRIVTGFRARAHGIPYNTSNGIKYVDLPRVESPSVFHCSFDQLGTITSSNNDLCNFSTT